MKERWTYNDQKSKTFMLLKIDIQIIINHNKNTITFLYELTLELTDIGNGACT